MIECDTIWISTLTDIFAQRQSPTANNRRKETMTTKQKKEAGYAKNQNLIQMQFNSMNPLPS